MMFASSRSVCQVVLVLLALYGVAMAKRNKRPKEKVSKDPLSFILKDYNQFFRPNIGGNATDVKMGLTIQDVVHFKEGTLEATVVFLSWLRLDWTDPRLAWDADQHGFTSIRLPTNKIWMPDIRLYNSLAASPQFDWGVKAVVSSNGNILTVIPVQFKVHCGRPKDPHANWECVMKFGSWTYSASDMNVTMSANEADTFNYNDRVWQITGNTAKRNVLKYDCCPESYIDITYNIKIIRN